jgi:hypothetical protein
MTRAQAQAALTKAGFIAAFTSGEPTATTGATV